MSEVEEVMTLVERAQDDARAAAREAIRRVMPGLKGSVLDPSHVESLVNETRLAVLESMVVQLSALHIDEVNAKVVDNTTLSTQVLLEYWKAVAKAIRGED